MKNSIDGTKNDKEFLELIRASRELNTIKAVYNFLILAKRQTYANENAKKIMPTRDGSCDYEYGFNDMIYHDTYFGGTKFMGGRSCLLVWYANLGNELLWGYFR